MTIVEIIPSLEKKGGAEVLLVNLIKKMSKLQDVKLILVCLYDGINDDFKNTIDKLTDTSVYFCSKKKGLDLACSRKLREIIKLIKPDIIHLHLSCLSTLFLAFPFGLKKTRIFQTIHSVPAKDSQGLQRILRRYYCKICKMNLVGISDIITKETIKMFPFLVSKHQLFTVYNGIQIPKKITSTKDIDLICVASVKPVKNQKMLVDSVAKLLIEFPNLRVALVGGGEQLDEIISYSKGLNLDKNIFFYEPVDDVFPFLMKSKIFVLTSLYEGNPISILEALGCGLPCVAPAVGGIPDIIKDGYNGFLFEVGNKTQFVDKVNKLLRDPCFLGKMSENAIKDVQKYDINVSVSEYYRIFKEALNEDQ